MSTISWALYTEAPVGRGSPTLPDVINRSLRQVLTASGYDPDADLGGGFAKTGHTHGVADISDLTTGITGITKLGTINTGVWQGTHPFAQLTSLPSTVAGHGITDVYTQAQVATFLAAKAPAATTIAGYGITDAFSYPLVSGETSVTNTYFPVGNPRRHGAVGNGIADDRAAFVAADTSAIAIGGGARVRVDFGTYKIGLALAISSLVDIDPMAKFTGAGAVTGNANAQLGYQALATAGGYNHVAIGFQALTANTTGYNNVAVGYQALSANTSGNGNVAVGVTALLRNTIGVDNTAIGTDALYTNLSGNYNTACGNNSLGFNTTGYQNAGLGQWSLFVNTSGVQNTAVGAQSLRFNLTGGLNAACGFEALYNNVDGNQNVAVGPQAGRANTSGSSNTFVGPSAGLANTLGNSNVAVGNGALAANLTANYSTAVGVGALAVSTAAQNTALGGSALQATTTGGNCTAVGFNALSTNVTGARNVALGFSAGRYELGNDAFYVDNQDRATTTGDKAGALLYGVFNAIPSSQTLKINAAVIIAYGLTVGALAGSVGLKAGSQQLAGFGTTDAQPMQLTCSNATNASMDLQSIEQGIGYRTLRLNPGGGGVVVGASGASVGFYGATPVARAAAIASPTTPSASYVQAEAQSAKSAIDAIRVALTSIGIAL
jgi:hypothetical protein